MRSPLDEWHQSRPWAHNWLPMPRNGAQPAPANDALPLWQEVQQVLDQHLPREEWLPFLAVVEQRARERGDLGTLAAVREWRQKTQPRPMV